MSKMIVKSQIKLSLAPVLTLGALALVLAGCGGGGRGADENDTSRTGSALFTVKWPEASRLVPEAARSIRVDLRRNGATVGSTLIAAPATTATISNVPAGPATAVATALPNADGTGVPQAVGQVNGTVVPDQVTTFPTLTMNSTVTSVDVSVTGDNRVGGTLTLTALPKDAAGNVVLVDRPGQPSHITWEVAGGQNIALNSTTGNPVTATALAAGSATTVAARYTEAGAVNVATTPPQAVTVAAVSFGVFGRIGIPGTAGSQIVGGVAAGGPVGGRPESLATLTYNVDNTLAQFSSSFLTVDANGTVTTDTIAAQNAIPNANTTAVAAGGNFIYIVDTTNAAQNIVRKFQINPGPPGSLTEIVAPAWDPSAAVVPDTLNGIAATRDGSRVYAFSGTQIVEITATGVGVSVDTGQTVQSLAVDTSGNVYAALANKTVVRYSASLSSPQTVVTDNTLGAFFTVDVATPGFVYVADRDSRQVKVYNSTGGLAYTVGAGQLQQPIDIAVDTRGWIYVLDQLTDANLNAAFVVVMPRL